MPRKSKTKRKLEETYGFTTKPDMEQVNVIKSVTVCNLFHFLFAASKACLMPFLTLFFRMIGFSATRTGTIMMVKTLIGFVWAPLWARCAISCNRRRCMLLFSLFFMSLTYLSLSVLYVQLYHASACKLTGANVPPSKNGTNASAAFSSGSTSGDLEVMATTASSPQVSPTEEFSHQNATPGNDTQSAFSDSLGNSSSSLGSTASTTESPVSVTAAHAVPTTGTSTSVNSSTESSHEQQVKALMARAQEMMEENGYSVETIKSLGITDDMLYSLIKKSLPSDAHVTKKMFLEIWHRLEAEADKKNPGTDTQEGTKKRAAEERHRGGADGSIRQERDIIWHTSNNTELSFSMKTLQSVMHSLKDTLQRQDLEKFLVVLFIILVGELFASPVEKIADDSWYDFLEHIDDLEKYGKQRVWGSVAFTLVPVVVSVAVDYSPCRLPFDIHHFVLHFYLFGALMALTFLTAFFYPVPAPSKRKYISKVGKGLQVICCDGRGFLYAVTLMVMGMSYASYSNFLFWRLEDLGARHTLYGLCVMVAAFSEIPMLMLSGKLVGWLGNAGVAGLAMCCLAARTLFYSFLWTPWAVLPAELLHAFTHTALWYAVLSYSEFNVGQAVDRSIRSVLSSIYFGLGFSAGSVVAGVVFDHFGASILFQGVSVMVGVWCIFFGVLQKCLPQKERIKYSKLLNGGVEESDDSNDDEDDWLEMALKEH